MINNTPDEITEAEAMLLAKLDDLLYEFTSYYQIELTSSAYNQILEKINSIPHPEDLPEEEDNFDDWLEGIPKDVSSQQILDRLAKAIDSETSEHFLNLKYKKFLQTYYWSWVRTAALRKAGGRCNCCRSKRKLQVHHKTYIHRGSEHLYMDDLEVLCRQCHVKTHNE